MIATLDEQAIIACCTPQGSGAIALLRVSGSNAFALVDALSRLPGSKRITNVDSHTVHYGWIIGPDNTLIDQVMFIVMRGPKTFTGEDVVEITCHNNPFLIEAIIEQAIAQGARLAQEGEFTKRAFLNNKIDLIQAESINELIHASTHTALKQSLAQVEGTFSQWLTKVEKELIKNAALSEASFEFIDEEMEFGSQIRSSIEGVIATLQTMKSAFNLQQQIRQGVRIALIGSVNAGKSSLFNALLNKKRSIVTEIAGTTRDVIEAGVYKKSSYWTLIDTAGLRQTHDIVEQEGITRSYGEAALADCIVLIYDGSRTMNPQELSIYNDLLSHYQHKIIIVQTKKDLNPHKLTILGDNPLIVSVEDNKSVLMLEQHIENKIEDLVFDKLDSPFLLNKRHYNLLLALEQNLKTVQELLVEPIAYELLSHHLKEALENVTELTGKTITEQSMDAIFREFCVGK